MCKKESSLLGKSDGNKGRRGYKRALTLILEFGSHAVCTNTEEALVNCDRTVL